MVKSTHLSGFDQDLKRQKKQGGNQVSDTLKKVMKRPEFRTDGRCYMGGERFEESPEAKKHWEWKPNEEQKAEIEKLNKNIEKYNE